MFVGFFFFFCFCNVWSFPISYHYIHDRQGALHRGQYELHLVETLQKKILPYATQMIRRTAREAVVVKPYTTYYAFSFFRLFCFAELVV